MPIEVITKNELVSKTNADSLGGNHSHEPIDHVLALQILKNRFGQNDYQRIVGTVVSVNETTAIIRNHLGGSLKFTRQPHTSSNWETLQKLIGKNAEIVFNMTDNNPDTRAIVNIIAVTQS